MNRTDLVRIGKNLRKTHDVASMSKSAVDDAMNAVAEAFVESQEELTGHLLGTYSIALTAMMEGWNDSSLAANREARKSAA